MTGGTPEATGTPQIAGEWSDDAPTPPDAAPEPGTIDGTRFAHASEAEMARILDFYEVRWEYEPTTFPILWNLDGDVVESFAPDFYLPDLELFLEMTTLKQRLVRKKNRKLRRLRELYPGIRIKLFYARDFRAMMLKYGRLALAQALSGTPGQVVSERAAEKAAAGAALAAITPIPAIEPLEAVLDVELLGAVEPPAATERTADIESETKAATARAAAARPRGGRRRRRPRRPTEAVAEQETGA